MTTDDEILKLCLDLLDAVDASKPKRIEAARKRVQALCVAFGNARVEAKWNDAVVSAIASTGAMYLEQAEYLGIDQSRFQHRRDEAGRCRVTSTPTSVTPSPCSRSTSRAR